MMQGQEAEKPSEKMSSTTGLESPEGKADGNGADNRAPIEGGATMEEKSLMEAIVSEGNMRKAYGQVVGNRGSAGVDGMEVEELKDYLKVHWSGIKEELLSGSYRPEAVRKVMIPKPGGGERMLGIPTVLDRMIQQGVQQVLSPIWEETFSENSYGFRPGRSARQAIERARQYQEGGKTVVVDIDLAQFFDEVNHARLMSRIMERTPRDWKLHRLVHRYLSTGMLEGGTVGQREKGTPQGSPLSPLLSNIVLDELDKELEKRGHSFVRYADDCNIYVNNEKSGNRVLESVSRFVEKRMRLRVNKEKSKVRRSGKVKFLGFSFYKGAQGWRPRISKESVVRLRDGIREIMRRGRGRSVGHIIEELNPLLQGWINYYGVADGKKVADELDQWIRRKLRKVLWLQWKRPWTRRLKLMAAGLPEEQASISAFNGRGSWWNAGATHMNFAYPKRYFTTLGLISLQDKYLSTRN
jgi:RNA-directed DNA polymerase